MKKYSLSAIILVALLNWFSSISIVTATQTVLGVGCSPASFTANIPFGTPPKVEKVSLSASSNCHSHKSANTVKDGTNSQQNIAIWNGPCDKNLVGVALLTCLQSNGLLTCWKFYTSQMELDPTFNSSFNNGFSSGGLQNRPATFTPPAGYQIPKDPASPGPGVPGTFSGGAVSTLVPTDGTWGPNPPLAYTDALSEASVLAKDKNIAMRFMYKGQWAIDPNNPLSLICSGGTWVAEDGVCRVLSNGIFIDWPCLHTTPKTISSAQPTAQAKSAFLSNPDFSGFANQDNSSYAGVITNPSNLQYQVVNSTNSGYYITGPPHDNPTTYFHVAIDGADDNGRTISYDFYAQVGLDHINWNYGDGTSGVSYSAGDVNNYSVTHSFTQISHNPPNQNAVDCPNNYPGRAQGDQCFKVVASETYTMQAWVCYQDGLGNYVKVPLSVADIGGQPSFQLFTTGYARVLQAEGVPYTP